MNTDKAGPLWLFLESLLEPIWVRAALLAFLALVTLIVLAFAIRRK